MKRRGFLLPAIVLLLLPAVMAIASPAPPSNTMYATGGIFQEDQDYFISVNMFTEITRPTVFLQLEMPGVTGTQFAGGLGMPLAGMYLGGYYAGSNYIQGMLGGNGGK